MVNTYKTVGCVPKGIPQNNALSDGLYANVYQGKIKIANHK
ncbi:MAG: hypothetical protein ABIE55_02575 [Candidatus Aenigmatarchaeota archaeon]